VWRGSRDKDLTVVPSAGEGTTYSTKPGRGKGFREKADKEICAITKPGKAKTRSKREGEVSGPLARESSIGLVSGEPGNLG